MTRVKLTAGDLIVELAPQVGGSVARFGMDLADGYLPLFRSAPEDYDDALDAGCFPLVPFSNRIRDGRFSFDGRSVTLAPNLPGHKHPLHGQGWRNAWAVEHADTRSAELVFRHAPGEWPWAYEARQRFDLDGDGLWLRLSVRNLAPEPAPAGLGLHPFFSCDVTTVLDTSVETVWTVDDEIMPLAREADAGRYCLRHRHICGQDLDNGYEGWSGEARISWPQANLDIQCAEASRLQVYSPTTGGVFAAEPVSHSNAALNLPQSEWEAAGLRILDPDAVFAMATRFAVTRP